MENISYKYFEYYNKYLSNFQHTRTYYSHAITSGGAFRLGLSKDQICEINCNIANTLHDLAYEYGIVNENDISLLPAKFGNIDGWHDFDYMSFFYMVMIGLSPEQVAYALSYLDLNYSKTYIELMNNKSIDRSMQINAFVELVHVFSDFTKTLDFQDYRFVDKFVRLFDNDFSFGCQGEELLAKQLNIPIYDVVISDLEHDAFVSVRQNLESMIEKGLNILSQQKGNTPVIHLLHESN